MAAMVGVSLCLHGIVSLLHRMDMIYTQTECVSFLHVHGNALYVCVILERSHLYTVDSGHIVHCLHCFTV